MKKIAILLLSASEVTLRFMLYFVVLKVGSVSCVRSSDSVLKIFLVLCKVGIAWYCPSKLPLIHPLAKAAR
jgi:uncharacterized membrane protein